MNFRILWLDVAKGITIILMVIGHSSIPKIISDFIWTFHMPFFFMASGYTSKFNGGGYKLFVSRKLKTIMLQFLIYSVINILLHSIASDLTIGEYALGVLKNGWLGVPLWFVPVLFLALLVTDLVYRIDNKYVRMLLFLVLPVTSAVLCKYHIVLPWDIAAVPIAAFFVMCGHELRVKSDKFTMGIKPSFVIFAVCFALTAGVSLFWRLDLCWNNVLPLLPKIVGAISGSVMISLLAVFIGRWLPYSTKILSAAGKETFVVLAFSETAIVLLNHFFSLNFIVKYILLIVILIAVVVFKNSLKHLIPNNK